MSGRVAEFRVGEDISLALLALAGDPADIALVTAAIVKGLAGKAYYARDPSAAAITMLVSIRPAEGVLPAGWNIVLPAATSETLEPGYYAVDAKLTGLDGSVDITSTPAIVKLTQGVL